MGAPAQRRADKLMTKDGQRIVDTLRDAVRATPGGFTAVSARCGMERSALSRALNGSRYSTPSFSTLMKVAEAVGMKLEVTR